MNGIDYNQNVAGYEIDYYYDTVAFWGLPKMINDYLIQRI
jgi:hypothetical protein